MKTRRGSLTCLMLLSGMLLMATAALAAEIVYLEGSVQVQPVADKQWKQAEKGMTLAFGDSVRTARHSKVDIALDAEKKNVIRLDEKTLAVLNSATANTIDRLDLVKGRVYSNLEGIKEGLSFEVNTPSAVAGVRGSSYMVYVEKDQDEVSAYKDTVFLKTYGPDKNLLIETMLPEGFKTFIERFQLPSAFTPISKQEYMKSDTVMDHITAHAEGRELRFEALRERAREFRSIEHMAEQTIDRIKVIEDLRESKDLQDEEKSEENIEDFTEPESGHGNMSAP